MDENTNLNKEDLLRKYEELEAKKRSLLQEQYNRLQKEKEVLLGKAVKEEDEEEINPMIRAVGRTGRSAAKGAAGMADFLAAPIREGINLGAKALGSDYQMGTMEDAVTQGIDTLTGGKLKPKSDTEKVVDAITSGLASMPVGGAVGTALKGASNVSKIAPAVGEFLSAGTQVNPANIGMMAGATGTAQHLENVGEGPLSQLGGALLGGLAGQRAAGLGTAAKTLKNVVSPSKRSEELARLLRVNPEKYKAASQLGVPMTLGNISDSPLVHLTEEALLHTPGSGHFIQDVRQQKLNQIKDILKTEKDFTPASGGELLKKASKKNLEEVKQVGEEYRKTLNKVLNDAKTEGKDVVTPKRFFNRIASKVGNMTPTQQEAFAQSPVGKLAKSLIERKSMGQKWHASDIIDELSNLKEHVKTWGPHGSADDRELRHYIGALTTDLKNFYSKLSPEIGKVEKERRKFFDKYYNFSEGTRMPSKGKNKRLTEKELSEKITYAPTEEAAFNLANPATAEGRKYISYARKHLSPEDLKDFNQSLLQKLGTNRSGVWSPITLATNFKKLTSDSQKHYLKGMSAAEQRQFKASMNDIESLKDVLAQMNTSKTSIHQNLLNVLHKVGGIGGTVGLGALSGGALGGVGAGLMAALPVASTLGGFHQLSKRLLTNQPLLHELGKTSKALTKKSGSSYITNSLKMKPTSPRYIIARDLIKHFAQQNQNKAE